MKTNNQKGFFSIILGVLVLLLVAGSGVYYLFSHQNKPTTTNLTASPNPSDTTSSQTTQIPTTVADAKDYKTRYFSVTDTFWKQDKYPVEITQVADNALTPISCTPTYSRYGKDFSYYDEKTQQSKPLTDSALLNYIQMLGKKYNGQPQSEVREIFACSPQQDKTIILYSLGPCGGGCSGIPYAGIVNGSDISVVADFLKFKEDIAYFGCRKPLQLTKDNMFYFSCGGGDGPSGSASIYKLSMNNLTLSRIKHCTTGIDDSGKPYSKCE